MECVWVGLNAAMIINLGIGVACVWVGLSQRKDRHWGWTVWMLGIGTANIIAWVGVCP